MEHLEHPERFLAAVGPALVADGCMVLVIPAITNETLLAQNLSNPFHRSNLYVDEWLDLFARHGWKSQIFRHTYCGAEPLDFASPFVSSAREEDFEFPPSNREGLYTQLTLSGVYLLTRA